MEGHEEHEWVGVSPVEELEQNELFVDINEPDEIVHLLAPAVNVKKVILNIRGYADYMWLDVNRQLVQVERKQWPEMLTDVASVEHQLRRYLPNTTELHLLVEGVAEPTPYGIDTYKKSEGKPYYRANWSFGIQGKSRPGAYAQVMAWFWQLDKCGITVHQTANLEATAYALASWYKNSQKEEHTTLNRYYKERVQIRYLNPQVMTLMGIEGAGLGQQKAELLIETFGSVIDVLTADAEDIVKLPGFGVVATKKLLNAVGRTM